jgi:hypothetical protein
MPAQHLESDKGSTVRSPFFRIIKTFEKSVSVCYVLDSDHRFVYCNPAWDRFAKTNGAPELAGDHVIGSNLFSAIPDVLTRYYMDAFVTVRRNEAVWEQSYECSSLGVFRKYRMRIHFMKGREWFFITNPLVFERPHHYPVKPDPQKYVHSTGLIMMCAHCRCSKRVDIPDQWDFVPEHLLITGKASLDISHGLCPVCHAYFYPE